MQYFREINGKYYSQNLPGLGGAASGALRVILSILPVIVLGIVFAANHNGKADLEQVWPFIIMGGIFLLSAVFSLFLRRRGYSAGIVVDQMKGTISYKRPGTQRHTVPISAISEIGLQTNAGGAYGSGSGSMPGLLYLRTVQDAKHVILHSKKPIELRQVANELAVLTSLSVNEHSRQMEAQA